MRFLGVSKRRLIDAKRGSLNLPRTFKSVGSRETDVVASMMGEVHVIFAAGVRQPIGHADDGRAVDVVADAGLSDMQQGIGGESSGVHAGILSAARIGGNGGSEKSGKQK